MEKLTIGLLNDSFPPLIDGVANAVVNYAEVIEKYYGKAIVVTPAYPKADDGKYSFPVIRYPSINTSRLVGYRAGYPFSPETAKQLLQQKTALLHTHCPIASTFMARSLRDLLKVPVVFTYHTKFDIDIRNALKGKFLQENSIRALVQNIEACDEVWVVSRGAGDNLRSIGYTGEYIIMENGVDMPYGRVAQEKSDEAAKGFDLPEGVPVFLFVGRLQWYKGLRIILDALKMLQEKKIDFRMVFIGSGGDEKEVRAYAEKLDVPCFFTGSIMDRELLRAWYCRADLFLFPSTFDTNGLVVREAAACSVPSVLIRQSSAAEGIVDGENGFLIEENALSMAQKLTSICEEKELLQKTGEQAGKTLYLSWEDAVAKAYARYEIVIDQYRSGKYPKRDKLLDGFFRVQGELMEAFGRVDTFYEKVRATFLQR